MLMSLAVTAITVNALDVRIVYGQVYIDGTPKNGAIVEFLCPTCNISLTSPDEICQVCSSPTFLGHLPKGGIIEGCLKKGCYFLPLFFAFGFPFIGFLLGCFCLRGFKCPGGFFLRCSLILR